MPIESRITGIDKNGNKREARVEGKDGRSGLLVFTENNQVGDILFQPALNPTVGIEMALNGGFGGIPEVVHDGGDNATDWTGSNVVGAKAIFTGATPPTASPVGGGNAVHVNNPQTNDIWQFEQQANPSAALDLAAYTALTLYVYVDQDWSVGESISICLWDTVVDDIVGDRVFMEDFINEFEFDTWQRVIIPFGLFGVTEGTVNAIRMQMLGTKVGKNPKIYIDDVQFEQTGTPVTFKVEAPQGFNYFISEFRFSYVDAYNANAAAGTVPSIPYDAILNQAALGGGILFQRIRNGVILFSQAIRTVGDSLKGGADMVSPICDGTNTCITIVTQFPEPVELKSEQNDSISIIIQDDLTGLISVTAIAKGKVVADRRNKD